MTEIVAAAARTNAELMADCARLGYLDGVVVDLTYGRGRFWTHHRPTELVAFDLDPACAVTVADCRALPLRRSSVDVAVFDPPYKGNGTSTGRGASNLDAGYGVASYRPAAERLSLILDGVSEALRVARRFVLVKCQDQITSGHLEPQTFLIWRRATELGAELVDLLHVLGARRQPPGRRQVHARRNYSTLLVLAVAS